MTTPKKTKQLRCPKCQSVDLSTGTVKGNYSAFNGYRFAASDFSEVHCGNHACRHQWRTRSNAVFSLPKMS